MLVHVLAHGDISDSTRLIENALCMRYSGAILFQRLRLFSMDLIIGDFLMGRVWAIVDCSP